MTKSHALSFTLPSALLACLSLVACDPGEELDVLDGPDDHLADAELPLDDPADPAEPYGGEPEPWSVTPEYDGNARLQGEPDSSGIEVVARIGDCVDGPKPGPVIASATTDAAGDYSLELSPNDTYCLRASKPGSTHLDVEYPEWTAPASPKLIPDTMLPTGELTGDGVINIQDGSIIGANYDCKTAVEHPADLDNDGFVCDSDLDIFAENFGLSSPAAW